MRPLLTAATIAGGVAGLWLSMARGAVTIDLGIGRTVRPLGPLTLTIRAPRDVVFDVLAGPYLGRTPRALESKLQVLERGADMVLAAHFTDVRPLVRATTVETVRFEPPSLIHFRLVRGPVPHVLEQFRLDDVPDGTELEYRGELGTDLWALGSWWGARVAGRWDAAVHNSLHAVKLEAERRSR